MVRFSLATALELSEEDEVATTKSSNNKQEDNNEEPVTTSRSDIVDGKDDDDEADHPLGFDTSWMKHATVISSSWGRTRFCLDPPPETLREYQQRWGYPLAESSTTPSSESRLLLSPEQTFPPLSSYLDPHTAPTAALARLSLYHQEQQQQQQQQQQSTALISVSSSTSPLRVQPLPISPPPVLTAAYLQVGEEMQKLAQYSKMRYQKVQQQMQQEQQQMQQEQMQFRKALQSLLQEDEKEANQIRQEQEQQLRRKQQQLEQEQREEEAEAERARHEQQKAQAAATVVAAENAAKQKIEQQSQKEAADAVAAKRQQASPTRASSSSSTTPPRRAEASAAAVDTDVPEYVAQAQKLVSKLVQVRASVAPFETSKLVSQRRLGMKKIVNGKVNTLSENVDKIRQVAQEVSQAIAQAREQDEQMKQQQMQQQQMPPEMARGKRYLVDLLASSAIVRAQAEGFNGPRGDGFPLASMLVLVSVEQKELVPIFAAHVYTVCPTVIPTLPRMASLANDDEEALQKSLGMAKSKTGEYETFERFLTRTEGIVSLVADIMSSEPSQHVLMGGHKGAMEWLDRFLNLLPPAPASPLPLITAPVLNGFLTRAGHMLANKHSTEFKKNLDLIRDDVIKRLDEGAIGKPSATRLAKTVEGGFAYFQTTLPSKSLAELYYGASGGGSSSHPRSFGSAATTSTNPFGGPAATTFSQPTISNPFGAKQDTVTSPFGNSLNSTTSNPFGTTSATSTPPNPFGGGQSNPSPFTSGGSQNNPSGSSNDSMMVNDPAPSPFGSSFASSQNNEPPKPFGGLPFSGASTLDTGMSLSNGDATTTAQFGGQPSGSPFGTGAASTSTNPSQFGPATTTPFGSPTPFGNPAPAPTPFGAATAPFGSGSTTPFGSGVAPAPSPFGQPTASFQSPFGQLAPSPSPFTKSATASNTMGTLAASPSPFSSVFGQPAPSPSPFGQTAPAPSPFGLSAPSPSPFGQSAPAPTPFGQAAPTPSPFGQIAPSQSPFGQTAPAPTPFGQSTPTPSPFSQTTPFGGGSTQFGGTAQTTGAGGRELCRYFARGNCIYGANCRYSHELPPGSNSFSSGASSSTPFGGPRR